MDKLKNFDYESVGDFAKIDHHRFLRTGFPEVIYAEGKTTEQIRQIFEVMRGKSDSGAVIMATRVAPDVFAVLTFNMCIFCRRISNNLSSRSCVNLCLG